MEGKVLLRKYLILVILLLLGQLHGYKSCVEKERKAFLELKQYLTTISIEEDSDSFLPTWTYDTKSDCCLWERIKCNRTSKRVTEMAFGTLNLKENSLLNLSLLHPFEYVRYLNLAGNNFKGMFDDVEGYKSLGRLRNLETLDLSSNSFDNSIFPFLNAATSLTTLSLRSNYYLSGPFPGKKLEDLTNLELLDLSGSGFNGSLEVQDLSTLKMLKSLNLSYNQFTAPMAIQGKFSFASNKSLSILRNLEILDLYHNAFSNSIFPFVNAITSLKTLFLGSNSIYGSFPAEELKDLTNLELLDLSENNFNELLGLSENKFSGSIPIRVSPSLRKLKALDISGNKFSASMGWQGICEMKNLQELDLSRNKFVGPFPICITGFTSLRVLDLSSNQLNGKLPSALGNLGSLRYLSLLNNNFEGSFSVGYLANLSELKVFKLNSKSKSFQVESEGSWKLKFQLSVIELPSCNLVNIPYFLLSQKDLCRIHLSDNKIPGDFPQWLLVNNTKLEVLFLQNNLFISFQLQESAHNLRFLDVSANAFNHHLPEDIGWVLPHLTYMKLANNGFQGDLPSSIGNMERLKYLDISNNNFHGKLPRSLLMGCYSMRILTLSHNKLSGEVFLEPFNLTLMEELSMDNNLFTGKIGGGLRNVEELYVLDISYNSLTGEIPSWLGEFKFLNALLLSNNLLEGEIPISLFNLYDLDLLDLSANTLSGNIPSWKGPGVLLLQDNNLSGVIPDTLIRDVFVLDLRNNRLSGNIPEFNNSLYIHSLLLRGNNLTGNIPSQLCDLRNIQLLDLSNNRLSGSIPSCFNNTSFVFGIEDSVSDQDYGNVTKLVSIHFLVDEEDKYFKSRIMIDKVRVGYIPSILIKMQFATKHRYDAYVGGNLGLLYGMDLSNNELSGEIPVELGGLLELKALNLSHNCLSGVIPESFSGLKNVESLDLSFNRLQGRIPTQLTELNSLAVFNVSFNKLSGVIPQGKQFNTFDAQSYLGNPLLCGQSINTSCDSSHFQEADESIVDMVSFYWSLAAAYVTILLGIFSSLSFDSPWSRYWFYLVDAFIYKAKSLLW